MNFPEPFFPLSECEISPRHDAAGRLIALDVSGPRQRRETLAQAYADGTAAGHALAEHFARLLIMERLRTAELRQQLAALQSRASADLRAANARLKAALQAWPARQIRRPRPANRRFIAPFPAA